MYIISLLTVDFDYILLIRNQDKNYDDFDEKWTQNYFKC